MITLVVDFHSSTTYLQSQKFLALVTTSKYFFQSVRKILLGPCILIINDSNVEKHLFDLTQQLRLCHWY